MNGLPSPIINEVIRQQEVMGWPEMVPAWAEIPDARGKIYFQAFDTLTVADCEQLTEHHSRIARESIEKWSKGRTQFMLRKAGRNILYARLYRCRYLSLTGKTDSTEADMPQFSEEPHA